MKINSARQAWHDCNYNPAPGQTSDAAELGVVVQKTERGPTANPAIHGALAGHIQSAIARLHFQLRAFGNAMYAAEPTDDDREEAEDAVFNLACSKAGRMTANKRERAEFVAKGVFRRYRYMHQGGQSANPDPLIKPEVFRAWLKGEYDVELPSVAWGRDWEPFVQLCFDACYDIDARALSPIGGVIYKIVRTASLHTEGAYGILASGIKAPAGYYAESNPVILSCRGTAPAGAGFPGAATVLPFPVMIPAGQGLWAANGSSTGLAYVTGDPLP